MLDWNDLRYVLETARNGGTSGAARALGVNHATVARRISAAETALGERLFDRLPSGYVPTEAGLEAVRTAEAMARLDSELDLKIAAKDDRIKGRLRVTAPQLLIQRVLGSILADFTDAYPDVDVEIVATNDTLNLAQREADVAIRFSNDPPENLIGRRFIDQKGGVYATPDFIARSKNQEAPFDWIRFSHWPGPPKEIKAVRPNLRVRLTVDDMAAAIGAVRAGIGATRMACFLGDTDPLLARVPGMPLFDYLPLWLLTHSDLRQVPRIKTFMEFTAARLRKLRPVFEGEMP